MDEAEADINESEYNLALGIDATF
eukprot:COSAG05_NODE_16439_length_346_cov_0.623482_1_plen_23_part_01